MRTIRVITAVCFTSCLLVASSGYAAVVNVFLGADVPVINIGDTATLTVSAQVKSGHATSGNGLFSWDMDLAKYGDTDALGFVPASYARGAPWSGVLGADASSGMVFGDRLDAVFDYTMAADVGLTSPVILFSIDVEGLKAGTCTVTVEADYTVGSGVAGSDILTVLFGAGETESGGDYSGASVDITVLPEPATLALLGVGGLLVLRRRRR